MQYLLLIYNDDAKLKAATPAAQQAFGKDYQAFNAWLTEQGSLRGTATWPPRSPRCVWRSARR